MVRLQKVRGSRCMDKENFRAAKSINVFLNGDPYTPARPITLPKRLESAKEPEAMQGLFAMMTKKLKEKMQFREAIHHLLTPYGGTRVKTVKDLEDDADYVACHKNKLVRIDYDNIPTADKKYEGNRTIHTTWSKLRADPEIFSDPISHSSPYAKHYNNDITDPKPHYGDRKKRKVIHIYGNGDPISATKILLAGKLARDDSESFQLVLNYISDRVGKTLASTRSAMAARRLYSLDGKRITKASQITDGESYIVCGDQKLKRVPYGEADELQPVWKGSIKPPRTNDGRIKMNDPSLADRPTTVKPKIKLPKLTKKKVDYSEKFMTALSRSNSPRPH